LGSFTNANRNVVKALNKNEAVIVTWGRYLSQIYPTKGKMKALTNTEITMIF